MICVQFIFKPHTYDENFRRLDAQIDEYARSLAGFDHVERYQSADGVFRNSVYYVTDRESLRDLSRFPQHLQAKENVARWYDGYRLVVSEITATYGDGRLGELPV